MPLTRNLTLYHSFILHPMRLTYSTASPSFSRGGCKGGTYITWLFIPQSHLIPQECVVVVGFGYPTSKFTVIYQRQSQSPIPKCCICGHGSARLFADEIQRFKLVFEWLRAVISFSWSFGLHIFIGLVMETRAVWRLASSSCRFCG